MIESGAYDIIPAADRRGDSLCGSVAKEEFGK